MLAQPRLKLTIQFVTWILFQEIAQSLHRIRFYSRLREMPEFVWNLDNWLIIIEWQAGQSSAIFWLGLQTNKYKPYSKN